MEQLKPTDYSQKTNWYKIPEITKEFDTFYIYSTIFMGSNEGDPDYATLDNAEMLAGIPIEHAIKSSVFEATIRGVHSSSLDTARAQPSSVSC